MNIWIRVVMQDRMLREEWRRRRVCGEKRRICTVPVSQYNEWECVEERSD
jgi:hypothetical protein